MPFRKLYNEVQALDCVKGLDWYVSDVQSLSWVQKVQIKRSALLNKQALRGLVIKHNPGYMPHQLEANYSIILASGMTREDERFVSIKELMHLYFGPDGGGIYATDSEIAFENHFAEFFGGSARLDTNQVKAEKKALWMAMAVLCPEQKRRDLRQEHLGDQQKPIEEIATYLRVPVRTAKAVLSDQYEREISDILN